jgi:hypothetical protein
MLLPYRPQITGGGSLALTPAPGWEAALEVSGQGRRFTNRTETLSLPPYLLLDASAGFPAVRGLRLRAYMAWNLSYAGTPTPVSGQIKRWWGTLPNTVYGHPADNLENFFGLTIETGETP